MLNKLMLSVAIFGSCIILSTQAVEAVKGQPQDDENPIIRVYRLAPKTEAQAMVSQSKPRVDLKSYKETTPQSKPKVEVELYKAHDHLRSKKSIEIWEKRALKNPSKYQVYNDILYVRNENLFVK